MMGTYIQGQPNDGVTAVKSGQMGLIISRQNVSKSQEHKTVAVADVRTNAHGGIARHGNLGNDHRVATGRTSHDHGVGSGFVKGGVAHFVKEGVADVFFDQDGVFGDGKTGVNEGVAAQIIGQGVFVKTGIGVGVNTDF